MKRTVLVVIVAVTMLCLASLAYADLEGFLKSVNVQARADMKNFSIRLSTQFGVPVPQVEAIVKTVAAPEDAFMVLQLGQMSGKKPETVLQTYQKGKGRGWGELAKELGIKPGSKDFHRLKSGDLHFSGEPAASQKEEKGKGKGHKK